MAPVFSKPCHSQKQSTLCRLPAEIRLIILRELLHFPSCHEHNLEVIYGECYADDAEHDREAIRQVASTIRSGLHLLQCCQLLHTEASHVLYSENVLRFEFGLCGHIFSSLPGVWGAMSETINDIRHNPREDEDADACWRYLDRDDDEKVFSVMNKFQAIKIGVRKRNPISTGGYTEYEACRMMLEVAGYVRQLRVILQNKDLDVEFSDYRLMSCELSAKVLSGFKILRCASIKVNGKLAPSCITQYTAGTKQIRDTYREWQHLYSDYVTKLPSSREFIRSNRAHLEKADEAASQYDSAAFSEIIKTILLEARKWTNLQIERTFHNAVTFKTQSHALSVELKSELDHYIKEDFCSGLLDFDLRTEVDLSEYPFPWQ